MKVLKLRCYDVYKNCFRGKNKILSLTHTERFVGDNNKSSDSMWRVASAGKIWSIHTIRCLLELKRAKPILFSFVYYCCYYFLPRTNRVIITIKQPVYTTFRRELRVDKIKFNTSRTYTYTRMLKITIRYLFRICFYFLLLGLFFYRGGKVYKQVTGNVPRPLNPPTVIYVCNWPTHAHTLT